MREVQHSFVQILILVFLSALLRAEEKTTLTIGGTPYIHHGKTWQDDDYYFFLKTEKPTSSDFTQMIDKYYTTDGKQFENDHDISSSELHYGTLIQTICSTLCLVAFVLAPKHQRKALDMFLLCNYVKPFKSDGRIEKKLDYHHIFNFHELPEQINTVAMLSVEKITVNRGTRDYTPKGNFGSNDNDGLSRYGPQSNTNNLYEQGATGGTPYGFTTRPENIDPNEKGADLHVDNTSTIENNAGKMSQNHELVRKTRNNYSVVDGAAKNTSYSSRPRHPDYADKRARDQSFRNWSRSGKPDPDVMSAAGFYSIDYEDSVRCFHCGGGLFGFTPSMDPFEEHLKHFPACEYIRNCKRSRALEAPCSKDGRRQHQNEAEKEISTTSNSDPKQNLSYTDIKSLLEMGFKKDQVEQLILRQFSSGPDTTSTDSAHQTLASNEPASMGYSALDNRNPSQREDKTSTQLSSTNAHQDEAHESSNEHSRRQKEVTNGPIVKDEDAVHSLKEENHKLRETMLCKICLDRDSTIVFMNCGHMVSCPECAPSLRKCPICRKLIRERIKIL